MKEILDELSKYVNIYGIGFTYEEKQPIVITVSEGKNWLQVEICEMFRPADLSRKSFKRHVVDKLKKAILELRGGNVGISGDYIETLEESFYMVYYEKRKPQNDGK
ncbi:hypothetical protein SAMN04515674_101496 [Pseudarcicella hirudinis]|uniref:Uncharacterized protein n=1 Tax=Pseudarcicella hirudinis TaxID=1079859 RepID=A0A1I5MXH1_9BACT|nr:hypothetical protein [Pseudarcicella hirudinis]SFP14244.1 hypothetical protein SAMN04515674_101496 [Pseudarcicella hirudinis]